MAGTQKEDTMTFPDALRLLELFHKRDYAQAKPHLYFKSLESGYLGSAQRDEALPSDLQIAILDVENKGKRSRSRM